MSVITMGGNEILKIVFSLIANVKKILKSKETLGPDVDLESVAEMIKHFYVV